MSEYILITSRLIECREKLGISKNVAAKRIGVSQPAYLRYESGERTPSIQVIKEIANVFGTSTDYLTGKTDNPDISSYVISKEDSPELFSMVEDYFKAEKEQQKRFLEYFKNFQR